MKAHILNVTKSQSKSHKTSFRVTEYHFKFFRVTKSHEKSKSKSQNVTESIFCDLFELIIFYQLQASCDVLWLSVTFVWLLFGFWWHFSLTPRKHLKIITTWWCGKLLCYYCYQIIRLTDCQCGKGTVSVRRPCGAARTSVRPILSVRCPCGVFIVDCLYRLSV